MAAANRLTHGPRDMLLSLLALLLIIGAILVANRACSFSPGAPQSDPATAPKVDVAAGLRRADAPFTVRNPSVPITWQGNSLSSAPIDTARVIRSGWLTPTNYIQLSQSNGSIMDLVAAETGSSSGATGTVDIAGVQWTIFPARRSEQAWVTDLGPSRLLITGDAPDPDFRTLASAATH
ncbi:DUF4245 domain-containing protein [Actinokineospora enzanensis]|uniref:DUF4245 domain-containing protein n=1 Tax=Actinokineospora enzanensis TaxID=155975 RepID=UPI00038094C2|nr:DUF4245 domain-containing protein [Actinokineospora enzanensis]